MAFWSHVRSFVYSSGIVAFALIVMQIASMLIPGINVSLILMSLLMLIAQTAMYTGRREERAFSNTPLDPHTSVFKIVVAIIGAVILQFVSSYLYMLVKPTVGVKFGVGLDDLFLSLLTMGIIFPIFEELGFRQALWATIIKIGGWFNRLLAWVTPETPQISDQQLQWVAAGLTSLLFVSAHIPAWGLTASLFLIPITLFLTALRMWTGGIFTSSIAHITFNSVAVFLSFLG